MLANEGTWAVSEMCSALGVTRQGHCAWRKRPPSARMAGRRTRVDDSGDPRGELRDLRRPEGLRRAAPAGREHLAQARRAHHVRERARRHHQEARQEAEGRVEAGGVPGERGARPGEARVQRRRPRQAPVRRHHLRRDPPGPAAPRDRHGHMVPHDRGTVQVAPDDGSRYVSPLLGGTMRGAGIEPSMGFISSPWGNAATESLMGLIKAECAHSRGQGAVDARDIRAHRVLLQQGPHALGAGEPQPRGIRGEESERRCRGEGGVEV